jgi:ubiquinone/menaquinone biosynthesis C-methylase UbiE
MTVVRSVSFDPIAARYDATRGGEARGRVIADILRPWLPADGPIVEIGVGTAVVASAADGAPVIGLDLSPAMLDIAAQRFGGPLVQADAGAIPLRSGTVAAVSAVWVLHLVGDRSAVVAECHRILRPGGRLLAVVADESRRVTEPAVLDLERRFRRRGDDLGELEPRAAAAGFGAAQVQPITAFGRSMTPGELADQIEQRTWSWLWEVPAEAWATEVVPVIEALRRDPDPDRPRPHQIAHQLVVWER